LVATLIALPERQPSCASAQNPGASAAIKALCRSTRIEFGAAFEVEAYSEDVSPADARCDSPLVVLKESSSR
jgi:hypothetical protein